MFFRITYHIIPTIFLIAFLNIHLQTFSRDKNYKVIPFKGLHILETSEITAIHQDKTGFLWIGTNNGLVRYDGNDFLVYTHILGDTTGLSSSHIKDIEEDNNGMIWIATRGGGLNVLNTFNLTIKSYLHNPSDKNSLPENDINFIEIDKYGYIWLGMVYKGLIRFNPSTGECKQLKIYKGQKENGISKLLIKNNKLYVSFFIGGDYVFDIEKYSDLFPEKKYFKPINKTTYLSVYENNSISITYPKNYKFSFRDKNQILWIATQKGLYKAMPEIISTHKIREGNNIVNCAIELPNGNILLGLWEDGLYEYNIKNNTYSRAFKHLNNNGLIISLLYNKPDFLWVGTWNGIFRYNLQNRKEIPYSVKLYSQNNLIKDLYTKDNERVWIASWGIRDSALFCYNNNSGSFKSYPTGNGALSHVDISCVIVDFKGIIWAGTSQHGLNKIEEKTDTTLFTTFRFHPDKKHAISSNIITDLFEDSKKRLWIGTGEGLCLLNRNNNTFFVYNHKQGLAENYINAIVEDDKGNLWVTTKTSLARFCPDNEMFVNYFQSDGIDFRYFTPQSGLKDKTGKIYFGGEGGYISFFPDSLKANNYSPLVVFTSFWLNNQNIIAGKTLADGREILEKDISMTKTLNLQYDDNVLSFEFSTLDFLYPEKIKYAYKLEGFNDHWIYTDAKRRYITYTNLNPGTYTLLVKSTDSHGIWNAVPAKMEIIISAPFWQTWWFVSILVITGLILINVVKTIRINYIRKQQKAIENLVLKRTDELKTAYKNIQILSDTGQKITASIEIQSIISAIYNQLNKLMDAPIFAIGLMNFENQNKMDYFGCHEAGQICSDFKLSDDDKILTNQCIRNKSELLFNKINQEMGVKSGILIPLIKNKKTLGVLIVKSNKKNAYSRVQLNLLKNLAVYITSSIENAKSYLKILDQKQAIEKYAEQEQQLNEMKLRYFTEISHEFRTPLTLIKLPVQKLIRVSHLTDNEHKELKLAEKNIEYMLRLIEEVIEFERIDIIDNALMPSKIQLNHYIDNIVESFRTLAGEQNIKLINCTKSITSKTEIWCDSEKTDKILFNLLSNAFKFTPAKGTIKISGKIITSSSGKDIPQSLKSFIRQNPGTEYLFIRVSDTGKGIKSNEIKHVFDRHYHTNSQHFSSSGIGLALIKKLIEVHCGKITVESEYGKGSKFSFCIPIDKSFYTASSLNNSITGTAYRFKSDNDHIFSEKENNPKKKSQKDETKNINTDPHQDTILFIEDNRELLYYLTKEFAKQYKIISAENGKSGLDIARKKMPNIIISDIMMPEMDGMELCDRLKNDIRTSHIPIIILTAKAAVQSQLSGLKTGADDYIAKPFEIEILKLKVYNILNTRKLLQQKFSREFSIEPSNITITSHDKNFLENAIAYIEKNMMTSNIDIDHFALIMNMSRATLYNKINALTGMPVNEFIISVRLKRAAQIFKSGQSSVSEVAYKTGFQAPEHFSRRFKKEFKVSPLEFIKREKLST